MYKALRRVVTALISLLLLIFIITVAFSKNTFIVYRLFLFQPFKNPRLLKTIIDNSAPLILCGLGVITAFRSGNFSLAGEGQVYTAMLTTAVTAFAIEHHGASSGLVLSLAIIAGVIMAGIISIPIALVGRSKRENVLLISFMVSQGLLYIVDGFIAGPLRDHSNNLVATAMFTARLPSIIPVFPITFSFLIAIFVTFALWLFFERTPHGVMLTLYGRNETFAKLQGYPVLIFSWIPIIISGFLHGLAGSLIVTVSYGRVIRGMSGGIGWNAIGTSLIAANKPAFIPFAALLFSWLDTMTQYTSALGYLSFNNTILIKALVILFIASRKPDFLFVKRASLL